MLTLYFPLLSPIYQPLSSMIKQILIRIIWTQCMSANSNIKNWRIMFWTSYWRFMAIKISIKINWLLGGICQLWSNIMKTNNQFTKNIPDNHNIQQHIFLILKPSIPIKLVKNHQVPPILVKITLILEKGQAPWSAVAVLGFSSNHLFVLVTCSKSIK